VDNAFSNWVTPNLEEGTCPSSAPLLISVYRSELDGLVPDSPPDEPTALCRIDGSSMQPDGKKQYWEFGNCF
jgi:hypothetical protein